MSPVVHHRLVPKLAFVVSVLVRFGCAADYETTVAPIFREHCVRCHGEDLHEAELRLDSERAVLAGSEAGAVVTPRALDTSRLWEVASRGEMPPEDEGRPLNQEELASLRTWIHELAPTSASALDHMRCYRSCWRSAPSVTAAWYKKGDWTFASGRACYGVANRGRPCFPQAGGQLVGEAHSRSRMPPREKLAKYSVKPVTDAELATIEAWIAAGAPWRDGLPSTEMPPKRLDAPEHWAFRPPREPPLPPPTVGRSAHPIDRFVHAELAARGLAPNPPASKRQLARRLALDLTGLLPAPAQVERFVASEHPEAYEQLVDQLLASPAYGERWGQYWLDLAGYADSEGVQHADPVRPHAYRYRDYVIRAINQDKPYDRFLLEQLAGDELADYENAETITPEIYDNLVATGFLRMSSDGTFAGITGFLPNRLDVIDDQLRIFSSAVLGLTVRCARCHAHKFDPIPQRDYYRLAAVFKGAMDEFDWLRPLPGSAGKPRYLPHVTTLERHAWEDHQKNIAAGLAKLQQQKEGITDAARLKELDAAMKELETQRRPEPQIRALWDNGDPSPTYVRVRGDYRQIGEVVGPGVPRALAHGSGAAGEFRPQPPWPGAKKTGNRLALARWVVAADHPLTARVMVNRIWKHHFGRGLVEPLDDFGKAGGRPTHPALLDWLTVRFVQGGFHLKWLHRQIVTSSTYQQSSARSAPESDPDNLYLARMPLRRMEAEVLRDCLLELAGRLDRHAFGPAAPVTQRKDGLVTSVPQGGGWRRSIYVQKRRTQRLTLLDNFDRPRMSPQCVDRRESNVAPQALHLLNNAMIRQLSAFCAERVRAAAGDDEVEQIDWLFHLALARPPTVAERHSTLRALRAMQQFYRDANTEGDALANVCHALMNSASFLYID